MNSPIKPRDRSWIITTCRGRAAHLRVSLPTWLERLADWEPIIVCCDDPEAAEYVAGELALSQRGILVSTNQGETFNKMEAIRLGAKIAASGFAPRGQSFGDGVAKTHGWIGAGERDMVALLDADTVANDRTWRVLAAVDPSNAGMCGTGTREDLGFLVCSLRALWAGLEQIPAGMFDGYGPEDASLRIAVWTQIKKPFLLLPADWARKRHPDALRTRFQRQSMKGSVLRNKLAQVALMRRLVAPEELARCKSDCLRWPGRVRAN